MNLLSTVRFFTVTAARKPLLFSAQEHVNKHSDELSELFDHSFGEWKHKISKGKGLNKAELVEPMADTLASAQLAGYQIAGQYVGKVATKIYSKSVRNKAKHRALEVNRTLANTTKKLIHANSDYATSSLRAMRAAKYEAGKAFYAGVKDGMKGSGFKKRWITSSSDPCVECADAEDEGVIGIDDVFGHGQGFPLLHLSCQCGILVL